MLMLMAEFLGRLDQEMTSHYKRGAGEIAGIKVERGFVGCTPEWLVGHFAVRHAADLSEQPHLYLALASALLGDDSGLAVVRTFPQDHYPDSTFALAVDPTARIGGEHSPELAA